jgi:hypothetical protein
MRHPLHCLIPDHLLSEIARRGNEADREAALDTLAVSATLRTLRSQAEARQAGLGAAAAAAAAAPFVGINLAEPKFRCTREPTSARDRQTHT